MKSSPLFLPPAQTPRGSHLLSCLAVCVLAMLTCAAPGRSQGATVEVTAPASGDRIVPGTSFVISASATGDETVGPVTGVEFFVVPNNGATLPVPLPSSPDRDGFSAGSVPLNPFVRTATLPGNDRYTLYAVATYSDGSSILSGDGTNGPVVIGEQGTVPTVSITSPVEGDTLTPGVPVTITSDVRGGSGSITQVDFVVNGEVVESATAEPFIASFTPSAVGPYAIYARATDSLGNVADSDLVTVSAEVPSGPQPLVLLTQPLADSRFVVGSTIYLNATATKADGAVDPGMSLQFFVNGLEQTEVTANPAQGQFSAPFRVTLAQRIYSVQPIATQGDGVKGTAAPVNIATLGAQRTLPVVEILDLAPGTATTAGGVIPLRAEVELFGADPSQTTVEFYADGFFLGSGSVQPDGTYLFEWRTPDVARAFGSIQARVIAPNAVLTTGSGDTQQQTTYFASVFSRNFISISTATADPLEVELTAPMDGAQIAPGVPVLLQASASAPDGQGVISKVEFYQNGTLIGEALASPYQIEFTAPSPGQYALVAVAYSTAGAIGQSMPETTISAVTGAAPTVSLTSPATTPSTVAVNLPVVLSAEASDVDGSVVSVTFLSNGVPLPGEAEPESGFVEEASADSQNPDTVAPYRFNFTPTSPGRYEIVARAIDNLGNVTDSEPKVINASLGTAPEVSILNPADTDPPAEVTPGIAVPVTVNASDSDGSVTRVDLLVNGQIVGFSTQSPYIFTDGGFFSSSTNTTFTPNGEGTYVIVARATDNLGNVTDSDPVTVRAKSPTPVGLPPSVQVTQPLGEIIYVSGSSYFLNARATDAAPGVVESVTFTVNGLPVESPVKRVGDTYGVRYTPTEFGVDTIVAQATDDDGNLVSSAPNLTVLDLAYAALPQVQMLDPIPGEPREAGGKVTLRAEAIFPPAFPQTGGQDESPRVEFYANNVYVGLGTEDADEPGVYTFSWETPDDAGSYVVEARAVSLNLYLLTDSGPIFSYSSVISANSIAVNTIPGTAPVVEITSPANGSTVAVAQPLTISASAFVPSASGPTITEVTSPQAGTVTSVSVVVGQAIADGTPLVDIQVAPGFTGTVSSTLVGTVKSIKVVPGSTVSVGTVLLEVIPVTTVTAPDAAAGGTVTSLVPVGTVVQAGSALVGVSLPGGFTGTINAPITGVVTEYFVGLGDPLTGGQDLAKIEPGGGAGGTIDNVEFYANGILLGVDDQAPYSVDFTPNSVGLYNLNAVAYSNGGQVATSSTTSISATLGSAPVVTLTRPTAATATATLGTGSTAGQVTGITVDQSGSGYNTAPSVSLSAPPPGGVQATATAVLGTGADAGRVIDCTITNAGVGYTSVPTVTVAPPSGTVGSSLLLQASVSDSDGIITEVEFLVNGFVVQTLTAAPYSYNLPLSSAGTYLLQVRATDNTGNVGVSAVQPFVVSEGTPPTVNITSPADGATIPAGQPVTVTANASDADGSVVSVTFYQNGTQIGEPDTQAPYSATFTAGSPGQYTLVALALDSSGNLTESAPVVVTVPSTEVTATVVSPVDGAAFTLGTPVVLTATAGTTEGATISSVRFEVNGQPLGNPIDSAPYTTSFVPATLGSYSVRAIATDSSGGTGVSSPVTFTVNNPLGAPPSIWLSQPSQGNYLTAGSSVYLNFTTFDTEGEIDPATLRIFINGVPLNNPAPRRIGPDGNTFGVVWVAGVAGTYTVSAQVADLDGNTASSGTSTFNVLPAQKSAPQVTIEPLVSDSEYISVGLPIELRAKAKFFANTEPEVEFYANSVFVGTGVAGPSNPDGSVSYSLVWTPEVAGSPVALTARAVGVNFQQDESTVYASSISTNRPTPPVTDLTIYEVPRAPEPGSNEAFVKFIFQTIFNRPATYAEYIFYVDQLQPSGNPAPDSARATVIQDLLGTVEYNSSYNVVYSLYYRLGLTPTLAAALTQISNVQNNTADETGFAAHTTSQPQAPNLPTVGMALAAQNLLNTLPNQTTVGLTPNVTKPLPQFSNIEFINWLIPKLGGQAFNAATMVSSMSAYSPQLRRQGAALTFLTQLYATYAATNRTIRDSRPSAVGQANEFFQQENLAYDAKLKGITINFLLTGNWDTSTAPLSNSMLADLLADSAADALPVVTSGDAAGEVGEYFSYQIEATNDPGGYTAGSLPAWLRLDAETGLLTGRPGLGDDGSYLNVKIGAQNWAGEGSKFITIEVLPAPAATSMAMLKAKRGYPSAGALGFGSDGDVTTVNFTPVPGGIELVWTQLKDAQAYGVTYQIQQSDNLADWVPVALAPGQVPQAFNDGTPVPDVNDYERVRVVLPVAGTNGFYRVKATVPE